MTPSSVTAPESEVPAVILDPDGVSIDLWIEDEGERVTIQPRWLPVWFVVPIVLFPGAGIIGAAIWSVVRQGSHPIIILLAILAALFVTAYSGVLLDFVSRQSLAKGEFCHLDRQARILHLSRLRIDLSDRDIIGFVLVTADVEMYEDPTALFGVERGVDRLRELSVLTRKGTNGVVRYPVLTCEHSRAVLQAGHLLADAFQVELLVLRAAETQKLR